jgi:hypothetical protein
MVPAGPCVFEASRSCRNDVRVEIAATIRNRLISCSSSPPRSQMGIYSPAAGRSCCDCYNPAAGCHGRTRVHAAGQEHLPAATSLPFTEFLHETPFARSVACVLTVTPD